MIRTTPTTSIKCFMACWTGISSSLLTPSIETGKSALKSALGTLGHTLNDAHWADHNEQQDEDHDIPDDEWARIVARCAEAKLEASQRVVELQAAYSALREAQESWVQSLCGQIAKLDLQIAAPR
ncbi:hypothetical protein [Martelella mediterranea]|uniref:hypothetical protein n=1 Tax=Martelella mediterranea TaxID=293089 RepID=UPI0010485007|nr:hypothetical protein [Martelella mediterranea]